MECMRANYILYSFLKQKCYHQSIFICLYLGESDSFLVATVATFTSTIYWVCLECWLHVELKNKPGLFVREGANRGKLRNLRSFTQQIKDRAGTRNKCLLNPSLMWFICYIMYSLKILLVIIFTFACMTEIGTLTSI